MSAELTSAVNGLQEALILCRPREVLSFAVRYFFDEKTDNFEESHAIHSLPYLLNDQKEFKKASCTIFCQQITSSKVHLDGSILLEIIKNMNLGCFWFEIKAIEEVVSQIVNGLRKVDFELFVSALRFPIASYQLAFWLKDELNEFFNVTGLKTSSILDAAGAGASATPTDDRLTGTMNIKVLTIVEQTGKDMAVDVGKFKTFIQQRHNIGGSSSSASSSPTKQGGGSSSVSRGVIKPTVASKGPSYAAFSGYHMHMTQWPAVDVRIWSKSLLLALDELGASQRRIEEVANALLRTHFQGGESGP